MDGDVDLQLISIAASVVSLSRSPKQNQKKQISRQEIMSILTEDRKEFRVTSLWKRF